MSLGGKYVFSTMMCLVLHMCILTSCSNVLCVLMALGMFMFVKDVSSLMSHLPPSPPLLRLCVWWCSEVFFGCLAFCEFYFLYCDDVRLGAVYEFFSYSILFLMLCLFGTGACVEHHQHRVIKPLSSICLLCCNVEL